MPKKISGRQLLIITGIILVTIVIIGYATLSDITLSIAGSALSNGVSSAEDYKVSFKSANPVITTSNNTIVASASVTDEHNATFSVSNMLGYNDEVTIKYIIVNESNYFSADLTCTINNDNSTYLSVTKTLTNQDQEEITSIDPGEEATLTITGKVIKVPTDSAKSANVNVAISAESTPYTGGDD